MKYIDNLLDSITMYRLVLYYLLFLLGMAWIFCFAGILPFSPVSLLISVVFLIGVSWLANKIFAHVFNAPTNVESVYISALILALIISPIRSLADLPLFFWAAVLTTASKYILAIHRKHIFNPVAIAIVLTAFAFNGSASWWLGTSSMLPFSLLGLLLVRKIRRFRLVLSFITTALLTMLVFSLFQGGNLLVTLRQTIVSSPLFFFAFVMLTEPLTTPPTKMLQTLYGMIVGVLFAPKFHLGSLYTTPELSLVIGNVFSYLVSPKSKIISALHQKNKIATDMYDFIFTPSQKINFTPGQYMEWTLPHPHPDSRGNRRYFTLASSPTETTVRLGVKFNPHGSSFKQAMLAADTQNLIVGSQLSGDFTLPEDPAQKLVFMAGGIGVTPFRSIIKYLLDKNEPRPIILFYANKTADEIVYSDVFTSAAQELNIRTIYTLTDTAKVPPGWSGKVGRIDAAMITDVVPDFLERVFYLSGPHAMVTAYESTLQAMGVPKVHIKVDYFPGFV